MKKLLLLPLFAMLASIALAQPVLDQTGVGAIGSVYYLAIQDTFAPGSDVGPAGASQTWNLTTLQVYGLDTISYVTPASTGYSSDFPTANLAIQQASLNNGFGFMESVTTDLHLLGFVADLLGTGSPIVAHQSPPLKVSNFPFTYLDSYSDSSTVDVTIDASSLGIAFVDSARYKNIQWRDLFADGYGTLDLPAASYSNVLRIREINTQTDSIWVHTFLGWSLYSDSMYTDSTFTWSDNTKGYLLAQAEYIGGALDNIQFQDYVLVGRAEPIAAGYEVYPNPAYDRLMVKTDGEVNEIRICDIQGREIFRQALSGVQTVLNVGALPRGLYLYSLLGENGLSKQSGKVILSH